ncbi:MAG: hypothetical protein WCV86_00405 [Patescibacteria group bacterium]|jgi:hypothetical protein
MNIAPQYSEVLNFLLDHGPLIFGAFLVLSATDGKRFGPVRFLALVVGLALVVSGMSEFVG